MDNYACEENSVSSGLAMHGNSQSSNSMADLISVSPSSKSMFTFPEACVRPKQRNHNSESSTSEDSVTSERFGTSSSGRLCISCVVILFLFCIGLCSCVIYLCLYVNRLQSELYAEILHRKQHSNDICIPCSDLKLGPFPEDNENLNLLQKEIANGVEVCCAKSANQTTTLFNMLFEKKQRIDCANEKIESQQNTRCNSSLGVRPQSVPTIVAAHITASSQRQSTSNSTENGPGAVRYWSTTDPVSHVYGLGIHNDRIHINSSGLYFVYSQVYFISSYANGQSNEPHALYHFVYRYNVIYPNGGEELLMKGVRTKCWTQEKKFDDHTSYTGAAIYLNSGDELFVRVSNISAVAKDPKSTFFGLFKMS